MSTKKLIIHADDAGLSHSENRATIECLKFGIVNSYSIMVPCPWFYEMALFARENPQFDMGIHLTITCEWERYKFGPVSSLNEVKSLINKEGYFYPKRDQVKQYSRPEEVRKEFKAQMDKALRSGLKPTHIDSHMFTIGLTPDILNVYREIGKEYNLPIFLNRTLLEGVGMDVDAHITEKDFMIDNVIIGNYELFKSGKLAEYYKQSLKNLPEGISIVLLHTAFDDVEMKGITINHPNFGSAWRQIEYEFFTSKACRSVVSHPDIECITWKQLKSTMDI